MQSWISKVLSQDLSLELPQPIQKEAPRKEYEGNTSQGPQGMGNPLTWGGRFWNPN